MVALMRLTRDGFGGGIAEFGQLAFHFLRQCGFADLMELTSGCAEFFASRVEIAFVLRPLGFPLVFVDSVTVYEVLHFSMSFPQARLDCP